MKKLLFVLVLILAMPSAVRAAFVDRDDCDEIPSAQRIAFGTYCLQRTTVGGRIAGVPYIWNGSIWAQDLNIPRVFNASKPTSPKTGDVVVVTDAANTATCILGGGIANNTCQWNGANWVTIGGGGGGSGGHLFKDETIDLANQPLTYINCTGGGIACTSNVGTNSVDITVTAGAEADPVAGAVKGVIKSDGAGNFSSAVLGDLGGQPLDTDLTALSGHSGTGIWVVTGPGTGIERTLTCLSNQLDCGANGNGVAGNPTIGLGSLAVRTDTATTFGAVSINANAVTRWGGPVAAGITLANNGDHGYDSTAHVYKGRQNGVTSTFFTSVNLPTALAANGSNCTNSTGQFAIGVDASGVCEGAQVALSGASAPSPGTCPFPGAIYRDTRTFSGGSAGYTYKCDVAGGDFSLLVAEQSGYTTLLSNSGSATGSGGADSQISVKGDGTIITGVAANASPDTVTLSLVNGSVPPSKLNTIANTVQYTFHLFGTGTSNVIEDTQDVPLMFPNETGTTLTITQIKAWVDTGSTTIKLQRDDGSAADICTSGSGNIVANSPTTGVTCTLSGTEKVISNGHRIGLVVVTGATSGTPTHLTVAVTFTRGDS